MTTHTRILVTGATGKTGRATVLSLLEFPEVRARALVHTDDARAQALRDAGAEVVVGDMTDVRDMRRAMHDVQRAYFVAPFTNLSLDHAMNFAIAAEEAQLEHVVALGQWFSSHSHPSPLTRRQWLADHIMAWIPGVNHTLINVGWFADNFSDLLRFAAQLGVFSFPLGTGVTAPISNEDIGRVVAGVLVDPAPYIGRSLRPTGPELMSPEQIADTFGAVLGRKVRYMEVSDHMLAKTMRALGWPPFYQACSINYAREYRRGSLELNCPNDVVQRITGRPAEDLETILRRYAANDPTTRRTLRSTLGALVDLVRIAATPPLDVIKWQAAQGMPLIDAPEDSADSSEWERTHSPPNASWVATAVSTESAVDEFPRSAPASSLQNAG